MAALELELARVQKLLIATSSIKPGVLVAKVANWLPLVYHVLV
jgi:hypothetical protein